MPGADRFALDQHPYLAFAGAGVYKQTFAQDWANICTWSAGINASQAAYGLTLSGEWSPAINDCGLYLNGVGSSSVYETSGVGNCSYYNDWASWSAEMKANVSRTALVSMDSLAGGWFAWTWKVCRAPCRFTWPPHRSEIRPSSERHRVPSGMLSSDCSKGGGPQIQERPLGNAQASVPLRTSSVGHSPPALRVKEMES